LLIRLQTNTAMSNLGPAKEFVRPTLVVSTLHTDELSLLWKP